MHKALVLFFLGMFFSIGLSFDAQLCAQVKKGAPLKNDTAAVELRNFNLQKIKDYSSQKEFRYDDGLSINTSWWDRFWDWIWSVITNILSNKYSGNFFQYVLIAVIVALILFAISRLAGLDLFMLARKSKEVDVPYAEVMENIHEIDFNSEIDKAVYEGNLRLAVRLLYLRSLKLLSDQGLITWQPEKTNQAYVDELEDLERKAAFKLLTLRFEYIWYGDFRIDQEHFKVLKSSFERFNVKAR